MGGARRLLCRELGLPQDALLRLAELDPLTYPVLFDSASGGPLARHSVLVAASGDALWVSRDGQLEGRGAGAPHALAGGGFFAALDRWWRELQVPDDGPAAWSGGFAVFAGYELAAEAEPHLRLPSSPLPFGGWALRTPAALLFDHHEGRMLALAEPGAAAAHWLERVEADARRASQAALGPQQPSHSTTLAEEPAGEFLERVLRIQEHIRAGDLYQANLSRGWSGPLAAGDDVDALYRRLRVANPAPFAVRARWGGIDLLSSSPERLVRIEARRISTRPIAGTRPRVAGREALDAEALVAHPKERAEHVMLIDLERNDLGRICAAGSVQVRDFMSVETYAHVHHIVSEVGGVLRDDVTPVAALRAVFPGGTITGCPKLRCMQLIAALEGAGRGAYTGSIGMLGLDGSADFNILIRTLTLQDGVLRLRTGAGIVADSDPRRELEETRAKARGVLAALGAAP